MSTPAPTLEGKRTLVYAILKFLQTELKEESITPDIKESLEVASQCLESSYEISVDDEVCRTNFDANLDLLGLAEKSVIRQVLSPEEKIKADKHKSEGNELMKAEKFKDALEQYNQAVAIDKSNAVYYCNRAAAHSKLQDYTASIEDCKVALKIDPTYGKAWGRLGLALLSNNQFEESYEAYNKAIQLEPTNDGYKQNLKIVEEKLRAAQAGAGGAGAGGFPGMSGMPGMPGGAGGMPDMGNMMGMFQNPQFMNMATQMMADPQMQNVMSNLVTNMFQGGEVGAASGAPGAGPGGLDPAAAMRAAAEAGINPAGLAAGAAAAQAAGAGAGAGATPDGPNTEAILNSAQNWASQMNNMNPDFVQQLRERMNLNPERAAPPASTATPDAAKDEVKKEPENKEEKKE